MKKPNKKSIFRKRNIIIACVAIAGVVGIAVFSGYPQYWYAYLRCGQKPTAVRGWGFGSGAVYDLPSSSVYKVRYGNKYYCTESEVQADGIPQNPLTPENVLK